MHWDRQALGHLVDKCRSDRRTHLAPGLGATSPARNRQLHRVCPIGRRDNEQAGIGIARPASQGQRHLPGATQARFVAYRFPWTPSKSAHNRTYDGYTNHGPEITKSRTSGDWKPETCFWRFGNISRKRAGNLEVGLIGPQFMPNYR